jgi:hypothetical protein
MYAHGERRAAAGGAPAAPLLAKGGTMRTIGGMADRSGGELQDVKINVKLKISALWAAMMLLFAYGDIFGFFRPGIIDDIKGEKIAGFHIDQVYLQAVSLYILIPCIMVFLSITLRPAVSRWTNVILGVVYAASIVVSCIGETWVYYISMSIAETALLLLIVWYAWTWPKASAVA